MPFVCCAPRAYCTEMLTPRGFQKSQKQFAVYTGSKKTVHRLLTGLRHHWLSSPENTLTSLVEAGCLKQNRRVLASSGQSVLFSEAFTSLVSWQETAPGFDGFSTQRSKMFQNVQVRLHCVSHELSCLSHAIRGLFGKIYKFAGTQRHCQAAADYLVQLWQMACRCLSCSFKGHSYSASHQYHDMGSVEISMRASF